MYAKHAEFKVGLLVIAASLALLGLLFYATGGSFFGDWRHVHLRFEPGTLAPREGDPIQINGVDVGRVEEVELLTGTRSGDELTDRERRMIDAARERGEDLPYVVRDTYVHVVAELEAHRVLPVDTRGEIRESVTQSRQLILIPGDSPISLSDEDTIANPILVSEAGGLGSLVKQVGGVLETVDGTLVEAKEAIRDIRGTVGRIDAAIEKGKIEKIFEDVRETVATLRRTTQVLESDLAVIGTSVRAGVEDFKRLAASVARLADRLEQDVPAAVADVREVVAKVGGVVDRAAPKVDAFLDDVNKTGRNLVALSEELAGVGDDARAVVKEVGGDLDVLADVLIDTGRNLLDASEDLRAHPWKLLNEPSTDEIAHENLRSSMQNYVRAMQRMNGTARTLQSILERGDAKDPVVRALLERTLADFDRSVDLYRASEKKLVELLQEDGGGRPLPPTPRPR